MGSTGGATTRRAWFESAEEAQNARGCEVRRRRGAGGGGAGARQALERWGEVDWIVRVFRDGIGRVLFGPQIRRFGLEDNVDLLCRAPSTKPP
jgi:hypothetical protein